MENHDEIMQILDEFNELSDDTGYQSDPDLDREVEPAEELLDIELVEHNYENNEEEDFTDAELSPIVISSDEENNVIEVTDESSMLGADYAESTWQRVERQNRLCRKRLFDNRIDYTNDADDESSETEEPRRKKTRINPGSPMQMSLPDLSTPNAESLQHVNYLQPVDPVSNENRPPARRIDATTIGSTSFSEHGRHHHCRQKRCFEDCPEVACFVMQCSDLSGRVVACGMHFLARSHRPFDTCPKCLGDHALEIQLVMLLHLWYSLAN